MNGSMFALTKREQRAIAVIVLALFIATLAIHYRNLRADGPSPAVPTPIEPEPSGTAPPQK